MARPQVKRIKKKPLIVICSEGGKKSSEYHYFRNFATRNLRIQFSTGNSTDPAGMLDDLLKYIKNEDIESEEQCRIFLVLDTDLKSSQINEIDSIRQKCKENKIKIITSAPTFEIWYLMHYRTNRLKFNNSKDVKKEIEKINGSYNETMNLYDNIKEKTMSAVKIAKSIEEEVDKDGDNITEKNPHSDIYKVLDAIDNFNCNNN